MQLGSIADWVAAIATFAAVLVALFKDEYVRWQLRPELRVSICPTPPDCAKTTVHYQVQRTTLVVGSADCYFLRLWVRNEGRTRAEKVQVFAANLSKLAADGDYKAVDTFLPMNLLWSHAQGTPEVYAEGISPEMGKHCDLGHIVDPACRDALDEGIEGLPADRTVLALELEVKPNTKSHLLEPGTYRMGLRVAAANCPPRTVTIELNLTGAWFSEEKKMLHEGIGVRIGAP